jgi:hypothetical protein
MRRAAAIVVTVGVGFAIAYAAHERAPSVASRPDAAAAAPPATPVPPPASDASTPPDPGPLVAEGRRPADALPAAIAPILDADDRREPPIDRAPQAEVLGEHDDEFVNRYLEIAERFRGEPRNPTAAVSLEREILDRFAALTGLAVTTLDVTCRTTTCRIRMVEQPGAEFQPLKGPGSFQNLVEGFGTVVSHVTEADDGSAVFEWLLARDPPPPK